MTTRSVWVPPGSWEDAWNGSIIEGPATLSVTQPYERLPMWHRRDGGLMVLTPDGRARVEQQDWSHLVLEAFPSASVSLDSAQTWSCRRPMELCRSSWGSTKVAR